MTQQSRNAETRLTLPRPLSPQTISVKCPPRLATAREKRYVSEGQGAWKAEWPATYQSCASAEQHNVIFSNNALFRKKEAPQKGASSQSYLVGQVGCRDPTARSQSPIPATRVARLSLTNTNVARHFVKSCPGPSLRPTRESRVAAEARATPRRKVQAASEGFATRSVWSQHSHRTTRAMN